MNDSLCITLWRLPCNRKGYDRANIQTRKYYTRMDLKKKIKDTLWTNSQEWEWFVWKTFLSGFLLQYIYIFLYRGKYRLWQKPKGNFWGFVWKYLVLNLSKWPKKSTRSLFITLFKWVTTQVTLIYGVLYAVSVQGHCLSTNMPSSLNPVQRQEYFTILESKAFSHWNAPHVFLH